MQVESNTCHGEPRNVGTKLARAPADGLFPQEGAGRGALGGGGCSICSSVVPQASKWASCPLSWG